MAESPARFPRSVRLLTRADYGRVFAKPMRASDGCFTVLARPNGLPTARIGLAIAKKHAARAVARNRIKRIARETFREVQQDLAGLDLVILSRHGTQACSSSELRASLVKQWNYLVRQCRSSSSC